MKLIRKIKDIDSSVLGCALTMGNFDGVHLGHANIIERLRHWARHVEGPAIVFTFDPHPVRLLRPDLAPPPLTWTKRKADLLRELGVEFMIAWPTDRQLLDLTYQEFFDQILIQKFRAAAIIEGPNFYFGKNREGDIKKLSTLCEANSIHCEIVEPGINGNSLISSTRIRDLVKNGHVKAAREMLTQPYRLRGMVVHGAGRGAKIGFPTANLDAIDTLIPAVGVYAGFATLDGRRFSAAIHIGPSPTFGIKHPTVEVHLLDFHSTLYGKVLEIDFIDKLRGVEQFDSVESLKEQLMLDIQATKEITVNFGE